MVTTWQDTTLDWWAPIAALWVLDADLNLIGSLPRLAEKEVVESVRFDGTIAYVVTFEQVDPLFAIDLKDPTNPIVRSALKIPGFSRYLHLFGDGLLLGIGAHTELVEEEWGTRVSQTGLKLSLFDISDPFNVTESAVTIIDADSTEVEYNHKAAFVDVERGIIAFPTTTWTYDETTGAASLGWHYRVFTWDGTKFTAKTTINLAKSHPSGARLTQSDTSVRAIRVGEDLYVITAGFVNAYGMDSFNQIAQVTLK
jgi:uncharacterized secreted protein with C-terminal beta-propeller domain